MEDIEKQFYYLMKAFDNKFKMNDSEASMNTPKRLSKMYINELLVGYHQDPAEILKKRFISNNNDMIVVHDIPFVSLCAHHWLPFIGVAHVGYIPKEKEVVGLSKIPRLVECFSKRFQIQENMTSEIADALNKELKLEGCMVVTTATHLCAQIRGVRSHGTKMTSSAIRGTFGTDTAMRNEFLTLIKGN